MEFLAESIGLLDMDNRGGGGPPPATPAPQKPAEQTETEKITTPFSLSVSLFSPWGSSTVVEEVGSEDQASSIDNGGGHPSTAAADVDAIRINDPAPPPTPPTPTASFYTPNKKSADLMQDEPDDFGAMKESISSFDHHSLGDSLLSNMTPDRFFDDSAHSLLSPMTPPSPLTLSVSSSSLRLNFPPSFLFDNTEKHKGGSTKSCMYCNDPDLYTLCHCNHSRKDDNLATTASSAPYSTMTNNTTQAIAEAQTPSSTAAAIQHHPNEQYHTNINDAFTKHVTQRIDARTNYNCFTGTVDAVTGHLLHGTMLYQQHQQQQLTALETATSLFQSPTKIIMPTSEQSATTPMVYTGPFLTNYNTHDTDTDETPMKHGPNGECQYSNGYVFKGIYEYDIPKYGVWEGDGWRYEGGLVIVSSADNDNGVRRDGISSRSSSNGSILSTASTLSSNVGRNSSVIGILHPLPGNVLFDGIGTFTRFHPNDNGKEVLVYKGEFYMGLAHGVGKETNGTSGTGDTADGSDDDDDFFVSMGSTYYVYNGEFSTGLRHGVGTLCEDVHYYSEESDSEDDNEEGGKRELGEEEEKECSCVSLSNAAVAGFERRGEYYCNICLTDHFDDKACKDRLLQNEVVLENSNNLDSNNLGQTTNIDPGPDAAAGGSTPLVTTQPIATTALVEEKTEEESIPTTNAATTQPAPPTHQPTVCKVCKGRGLRRPKRIRTKKKQQRISSGIWCAGQCEIEDCRGEQVDAWYTRQRRPHNAPRSQP